MFWTLLQDEDSAATAAREFAEETLGLFGDCGVDAASVVRQWGGTVFGTGHICCGLDWNARQVHKCCAADQRSLLLLASRHMQALAAATFEARLRDPLLALKVQHRGHTCRCRSELVSS